MEAEISHVPSKDAKKFNRLFGKSMRISRHDYTFVWCTDLQLNGVGIQGLCDSESKTIYVDISKDVEETVIHEIVHAEFYEAGLRQRHDHDANLEEQVCEILAKGLSSAFKFRERK